MAGQVYHHLDVIDRNDAILKHFVKGFEHVNTITIMDEVDNFDRILLPIEVSIIDIDPDVGTKLSLEFQILFHLHKMRS